MQGQYLGIQDFMFVVNFLRLLAFLISRRIIFYIFGVRYLLTLNIIHRRVYRALFEISLRTQIIIYISKIENLRHQMSLKGYFLPYTTLYLTNDYFYGELIQNYLSLEDIQMLIHYHYKKF